MIADRYTKIVLTIIAAALVTIALRPWLPDAGWLAAVQPEPALAQAPMPKYEMFLPRAWGKLVGFSSNSLLLEGSDQILRVVDFDGKAPEYPKIRALIHWQ